MAVSENIVQMVFSTASSFLVVLALMEPVVAWGTVLHVIIRSVSHVVVSLVLARHLAHLGLDLHCFLFAVLLLRDLDQLLLARVDLYQCRPVSHASEQPAALSVGQQHMAC